MTPTQRTIRELKKQGRKCGIVERWIAPAKIRIDLFSIIDIIALDPVLGVVGIQSCGQSHSAHYKKITEDHAQDAIDWLETPGASLELWSWRKIKKVKGGKAMVWKPRVQTITMEDFE